jgi:OPA family glycerol-3-phosphate transporter-like MFS transporter
LLIGPYSYLAGAISLDFGGKRGGATACGIIDGVGYLFGGVVAGKVVSSLSHTLGWQGVFRLLAGVALLTGLVAACFLANQLRPAEPADAVPLQVAGPEVGIEGQGGGSVP